MKFAIFASGYGSNAQVIMDAVENNDITAELALVFSNKPKAHVLKRAEQANIETLVLQRKQYSTPQSYERDIVIHLKKRDIDFIVMAGFMVMMTPWFVKQYPRKVINVHPSLLPSFKGMRGIKDTMTYGCKVGGVTVHFVDEKMDHGPIILQEAIKVSEKDTLETFTEKIHKLEHRLFPKAIQLFVSDRLKFSGRRVMILDAPKE